MQKLKKYALILCCLMAACLLFAGCSKNEPDDTKEPLLPDGQYVADFKTDSGMFHVNEANNGKGILTVENGEATIHVALASKKIVNLFPGTAEDAQAEGAALLQPTVDVVTYSDGTTDEVYGFDIPVPVLDGEFDCALVGEKGTWYDHKVSVSNVIEAKGTDSETKTDESKGEGMTIEVTLSGGSGKAKVESPAKLVQNDDGSYTATVIWSSSHYEYMLINDVQYDRIDTEGNSTFEIPVVLDEDMAISALTTAMSEPHLIDYTLHFDSATIQ